MQAHNLLYSGLTLLRIPFLRGVYDLCGGLYTTCASRKNILYSILALHFTDWKRNFNLSHHNYCEPAFS